MPANNIDTIFPCPLSKGYGIPAQQAWSLLKVFSFYRFVLAALFLALFYSHQGPSLLGAHDRQLFIYASQGYQILTVISGIILFWRLAGYTWQAQFMIATDIVLLLLLMHACGGISTGMGILIAVTIAAGGFLIGGRCAMFFAALASLAVLAEQVYADYFNIFETTSYTYAGMLGAAFFTIALLSYILARQSEQVQQLATQQKKTISQLEELNQYIIQHLQSGIIIVNQDQYIQMANEAALGLANLPALPVRLADISEQLAAAFHDWQAAPDQNFVLLQLPSHAEVHARFMRLPTRHEFVFLVILEDIAVYNQRLQQSKLASLGRLTASIAHEIRNPLSAISHAGQLLAENPDISPADKRLTDIIQTHTLRVNRIISDILQLSRRTDSTREKVQLAPWLETYLSTLRHEQSLGEDAFKLLCADPSLSALIDPGHLKQILDNLCQNALRYGKPELGAIEISIGARQQAPCLEVIDNGSGINQEHLKHLFEPFFTTSAGGTGLGLYISKELAELNQAKLSYHLTENERSCFRLCLQNAEKTLIQI